MKTERLVVLLPPEEKTRITKLAEQRQTSVGELVRTTLAAIEPINEQPGEPADDEANELPPPSPDQIIALGRLADTAMSSMRRANAALDRAFDELEATKAYFAQKRAEREISA